MDQGNAAPLNDMRYRGAANRGARLMSELNELSAYIETLGGYDLEQELLTAIVPASWAGFPLETYRYVMSDGANHRVGKATMLNPRPSQTARWIYHAIIHATGSYDVGKARELARFCQGQSGFQFVVRGIHWEAMDGAPLTAFTFFDGVTVRLVGWDPSWPTSVLSEDKLDETLTATADDVVDVRRYARIQGTQREDYVADHGQCPVEGNAWAEAVRREYQLAWGADENALMNAKAKAMFGP
jgi:hypothetical protein